MTILSNDAYFAKSERTKVGEAAARLPACSLEGSTSEFVKLVPTPVERADTLFWLRSRM